MKLARVIIFAYLAGCGGAAVSEPVPAHCGADVAHTSIAEVGAALVACSRDPAATQPAATEWVRAAAASGVADPHERVALLSRASVLFSGACRDAIAHGVVAEPLRAACAPAGCTTCATPAAALGAALEHDLGLPDGPTRTFVVASFAPMFTVPVPEAEPPPAAPIMTRAGRVLLTDDWDEEGAGDFDTNVLIRAMSDRLPTYSGCVAPDAAGDVTLVVRVTEDGASTASVSATAAEGTHAAPAPSCATDAFGHLAPLDPPPVDGWVQFTFVLRVDPP
jgi:hypothetical protein